MPKRKQRGGDLRDYVLDKYARKTGKTRQDAEAWADRNDLFKEKKRGIGDFFKSFVNGAKIARKVGEAPIKEFASNPLNVVNPVAIGNMAHKVVSNALEETSGGGRRRSKGRGKRCRKC
jgi:hypothetical protein